MSGAVGSINQSITTSREQAFSNTWVEGLGDAIILPEVTIFMRGGFRLAKPEWWTETQDFLDYNPVAAAVVGAMNQWSSITTNAMLTAGSFMAPIPKIGLGRVGAGGGSAGKIASAPTGRYYSVAHEMKLSSNLYPGVNASRHFTAANKSMLSSMNKTTMKSLNIVMKTRTNGSIIMNRSPNNWVWHHSVDRGVMQLVPKSQHTPGSIFWDTFHPGGRGGMSIWGGGY